MDSSNKTHSINYNNLSECIDTILSSNKSSNPQEGNVF